MKKFSKIIASVIVAASMVTLTAVSASAADYGVTPSYPAPSNPTVTPVTPSDKTEDKTEDKTDDTSSDVDASTDKVVVEVGSAEEPVKVVTEDTIADAIAAVVADDEAEEVVIFVAKDEAKISEAAIGEIAKSDVPVTLKAENCSVTIDPALIEEVKDINLAMEISVAEEEVEGVAVPSNAVVIAPAQKGDFGMTVVVTVPAATVADLDAENIFFYYISDDGEIEDLTDAVEVNDDGSISVSISHASQYVVTDEEIVVESEDDDAEISDETEDDDEDTNVVDDSTAEDDSNPGTGVALFGTAALAAISAAAVTVTAKKRK